MQNTRLWLHSKPKIHPKKWHHMGRVIRPECIKIDRRRYFDSALSRQNQEELRLDSLLQSQQPQTVIEIRSLHQLDIVNETYRNLLVVVYLYSRSCGSCKNVMQHYRHLCTQYVAENARVVFVKHDVRDAFDCVTDVARMYDVHSVPSFLFLSDGAVMRKIRYRDSRIAAGDIAIQLRRDKRHLDDTIRRFLFQLAPSAMD